MTLATYTFLPWLRRGLSGRIETPAGAGASRATLSASFSVASEAGRRDLTAVTVSLIGPGDVTGVQPQQIIRTEPRAGVTDFEPNYLAAIDFYDEDFPWRYSPVSARRRKSPPAAVDRAGRAQGRRVHARGRRWPTAGLVHADRGGASPGHLPGGRSGMGLGACSRERRARRQRTPSRTSPRLARRSPPIRTSRYSRLLSPRKLDPNCGYTAFLVPAFEVGRKAGLGETVADTDDGTMRSWQGAADEFPIYFEWRFRTGVDGDFESLVRALVPRDMDPRVGIRDLDIAQPGFGVATATNPPDGLVGLEGALLAPTTVREGLARRQRLRAAGRAVLNAPAGAARPSGAADPLVAPPIYGCWHAQVDQVSAASGAGGWVNTLNLDPRYRAAAGIGARVIRANQERYVRIAWEQIGDVIKANQKIRLAQLATKAASAAYAKSLAPLPQDRAVALASPVFTKVLGSPTTLAAMVRSSSLAARRGFACAAQAPASARRRCAALRAGRRRASTVWRACSTALAAAASRPRRRAAAAGGATLEQTTQVVTGNEPPPSTGPPVRQRLGAICVADPDRDLAVIGLLFVAPILALIVAVLGAVAIGILVSRGSSGPPAPARRRPSNRRPALPPSFRPRASPPRAWPRPRRARPSPSPARPPTPPLPPGTARPLSRWSPATARPRRTCAARSSSSAMRFRCASRRRRQSRRSTSRSSIRQALAALEPHQAFAARFAPSLRVGGSDLRAYLDGRYAKPGPAPARRRCRK